MKDSAHYRQSKNTAIKQQSFTDLVALHIDICQAIWARKAWNGPQYAYIDFNGGPGIAPDGSPGSPRIFADVARRKGLEYTGLVYEKHDETYNELVRNTVAIPQLICVNDDHCNIGAGMQEYLFGSGRKWTFGIVYSDPSNAYIPFEALLEVVRRFPKMEVAINLAAASHKRQSHMPAYTTIHEQLVQLKENWIVRKPHDKFQWTILVGTSWEQFPAWKERGFYTWDSDVGREWYEKITMTKEEIRDKYQPGLLDAQ